MHVHSGGADSGATISSGGNERVDSSATVVSALVIGNSQMT